MKKNPAIKNNPVFLFAILITGVFLSSVCLATDDHVSNKSRKFEFSYGAAVQDVPANANVRVWFPIAESNPQQDVSLAKPNLPADLQKNEDAKYQNKIGYFELKQTQAGNIEFDLTYTVLRRESGVDATTKFTDAQRKLFLSSNQLVPIDGEPLNLLENVTLPAEPMAAGKSLYNVVDGHMKYDKSKPGYGKGDVVWACNSKTGNCTDFHSLFISLARSRSIPARFEIGFPIPTDKTQGSIGGYHCWAWFHVAGSGWSPVDISEADKNPKLKEYFFGKLTADRVAFSTGRDIELVPKSASQPLNYFVYPHVEVDGKQWPKEKIKLQFSFQDK